MSHSNREVVRISLPTPFPVGPVNAFLITGGRPILIDAGVRTEEAYEKLRTRMADHGFAVSDLKAIILTHGHLDHVGLLPRLQEESGAVSYAHPDVILGYSDYEKGAEENQRFLGELMEKCGVPQELLAKVMTERTVFHQFGSSMKIDHAFTDGQTVHGLTTYFVPGHSASDTLLYDAENRWAFTGDHLLRNITPNPLARRRRDGHGVSRSLVEYEQSLARTRALDINTCFPGHGSPFGDHIDVIDALQDRHERRTKQVSDLLSQDEMTPYQIVRAMYPKLGPQTLHFGISSALGHLQVLEDRGQAITAERDGVVYYRLAP